MNATERLLAIEEIKQLKARYFRCVDTKDWSGFADVFAPDAVFTVSWTELDDDSGVIRGNRAITNYVREQIGAMTTVHHGHMPEIELTSPTSAWGVWAMEDMLWWPENGPIRSMHGFGHYYETYEQIDGTWAISVFDLKRLRVDYDT